jgi:hypothetical protein
MDLAAPVRDRSRAELLTAYQAYLAERDGSPDAAWRTLSRREADVAALSSPKARWDGTPHAALFREHYRRFDASRPTPAPLLLLLAYVKMNALEAYAVDTIVRVRGPSGTLNEIERMLLLEETYHTKILLGATEHFGLEVDGTFDPPGAMKLLTHGVSRLPMDLVRPLSLASELFGLATFTRLLRAATVALRDEPELRDAMEERLLMVLTDEIGHVSFQRLQVGDAGFKSARALLPLLTHAFRDTHPEVDQLLGDRLGVGEVVSLTVEKLPEQARARAFLC